jgi:tetratricopeptide (TPR) repeat protein
MRKYSTYSSPLDVVQRWDDMAVYYVQCGQPEEAYRILRRCEDQLGSKFRGMIAFGYMFYHIELGNADEAEKHIPEALRLLNDLDIQVQMDELYRAQARIAELRKDYGAAIGYYEKYLEINPTEWDAQRWISRCQRELGELKKAKKNIETALKHNPWDPKSNYEAALLYLKMNDRQRAVECLNKTLEIWKNADTTYQPYKESLALRETIR